MSQPLADDSVNLEDIEPRPTRPTPLPAPPMQPRATRIPAERPGPPPPTSEPQAVAPPGASARIPEGPCTKSPGTAGKLALVAFGLENIDADLIRRCAELRQHGWFPRVHDSALREALRRLGEPDVDFVVDARRFPDCTDEDHQERKERVRHPGFHPSTMHRIVNHKKFRFFIEGVQRQWRQAVASQRKYREDKELHLVIAVYCRQGKHRSVAIAECLRHIGEEVEGLKLTREVNYLSKKEWGYRMCRCRTNCIECVYDPA